jgi:hypothetical protein
VPKVTLKVCKTCALPEPYLRASLERLKAAHGDSLKLIERKCLDVCREWAAVQLGREVIVVAESEVGGFEAKISAAVAKAKR